MLPAPRYHARDSLPPHPVRLALRTATNSTIASLNADTGLAFTGGFPTAKAAMQRVRTTARLAPEQLAVLAFHPDERVVTSFMRSDHWGEFVAHVGADGLSMLARYALAVAEEEQVRWTPVLDHLASPETVRDLRGTGADRLILNCAAGVSHWAHGADSAATVKSLVACRSYLIRSAAAASRFLPTSAARQLVAMRYGVDAANVLLLSGLAMNPALDDAVGRSLMFRLAEVTLGGGETTTRSAFETTLCLEAVRNALMNGYRSDPLMVRGLIASHAALHAATRDHDPGLLAATLKAAVRSCLADLTPDDLHPLFCSEDAELRLLALELLELF